MKTADALRLLALALGGIAFAWGVYAVSLYGWRDLYADQWRSYGHLLSLPFPDNILFLDNGHRPVVSNLLRVAEIAWFRGELWLQWLAGLSFAVAAVLVGWRIVLRDRAIGRSSQAAAAATLAVAVFWLANSRMLMHPNESVHTYLITLMAVVAAAMGARLAGGGSRIGAEIAVASVCCFIATFAFGAGIALFVAFALALVIARAHWANVVFVCAALAVTLAVYFALPGGEGVSGVLQVRPLANARVAAQWLASPVMYLLLPFVDGNQSGALPFEPLRRLAGWTSAAYAVLFGDVWTSVVPQALVGGAGIVMLFMHSFSAWQQRAMTATRFTGCVLAWFGLGVAGVVALSRVGYFEVHPAQIYASRYLPWACLFWAGLGLIALGRPLVEGSRAGRVKRPWVVAAVAVIAAAALAGNASWMQWARYTQALIRHQASAVLTDVYSASLFQGETVPEEVRAGLPRVREARIAMFAHPAAGRLGTRPGELPAALFPAEVVARARPFTSDDGVAALEIEAALPPAFPKLRAAYWVFTDESGVVIGYGHASPLDAHSGIAGFVRADRPRATVRAHPWPDAGGFVPGLLLRIADASTG
ncbi:MAG: hypothetical protein IPM30_03045 [Burkholderiales bacterium]|nr:hypothetical protein [Burkholderiales bacterium]